MWYFLLFKKYKCLNVDIHLKLDINCLFLQQLMFERSEPAAVRVLHHSWFRPEPSLPAWPSSSSLFFSVAVQPSLHFTLPPHPAPHPPQSHYWDSPSSSHHTLMTGYKMFQGRRPGHTQPHSHPVSTALAPLLSSLLWIPLWAQKPDVSFCPDHNAASQQVVHFSFWDVFLLFFRFFCSGRDSSLEKAGVSYLGEGQTFITSATSCWFHLCWSTPSSPQGFYSLAWCGDLKTTK